MINGKGFSIRKLKDCGNEIYLVFESSRVGKTDSTGWSKDYINQDIAIPLETALEAMKTLQELLRYAEEEEDEE